jgi:hypothetical protein
MIPPLFVANPYCGQGVELQAGVAILTLSA